LSSDDRFSDLRLRRLLERIDEVVVVIHWRMTGREEHVDVIYAFPRKTGYGEIDWEWVESLADTEESGD
jgi:hypothetical protein